MCSAELRDDRTTVGAQGRRLLWTEYRDQQPDGIGYTVFCDELGAFLADRDLAYRNDHVPGEKAQKPGQSDVPARAPSDPQTLNAVSLLDGNGADPMTVTPPNDMGESGARHTDRWQSDPNASDPPRMPEIGFAAETARALSAAGERGAGPWAWVRAVVIALLGRLDAVVRGADRQDWTGLRVMDKQPRQVDKTPLEVVEAVLERDTAVTTEIAVEFSERLPELIEREREVEESDKDEDETTRDQDWPVPGM